jgi:transposase
MRLADRVADIRTRFEALAPVIDERARRWWAATEARSLGHGGILCVSKATGMSRTTVRAGLEELTRGGTVRRIRKPGGGRKPLTIGDPELIRTLERLVGPATRGDPTCPLCWTCKSRDNLARALREAGHEVSTSTVGRLLHSMGYSLQSVRKSREGTSHPDRNAQFEYIAATVQAFQKRHQPVISVDTKKKELVGDFKNAGREWRPKGNPALVQVHDFPSDAVGKAIPYGVYDLTRDEAWVSVGCDHDTPAFAVASIRQWWRTMGRKAYPSARELLITADAGGSNGYRARAWKLQLQDLVDEANICIMVCHFPPGTSKWNKIEHRLFCHITQNWRGRPLVTYETVVNLIGNTRTISGVRVKARLDQHHYPTGEKIPLAEMKHLAIKQARFHGDWNYTINPHPK